MAMDALTARLQPYRAAKRGLLLPYFTAGFPDRETTLELVRRADALGAAAVEIGFPYSDSIADGPAVQDSFTLALRHGHTLEDTWRLASDIRPALSCGLIAMVSYSIVHRVGLEPFIRRAGESGFDGVILPDLPLEEAAGASAAARHAQLACIGLVAPTTTPQRRQAIVEASTGLVYRIAVSGTTGERSSLPASLADDLAELRRISRIPVCVGFGVSTAEHVREICRNADGAIVGSAILRRIKQAAAEGTGRDGIVESVGQFLAELMSGLGPAQA